MSKEVKLVVCNEPQNCGIVKELVVERDQFKAEKIKTQGSLQERFQSLLSEWFKEPRVNFEKIAQKLVSGIPWGIERDILWNENKALLKQLTEAENLVEQFETAFDEEDRDTIISALETTQGMGVFLDDLEELKGTVNRIYELQLLFGKVLRRNKEKI